MLVTEIIAAQTDVSSELIAENAGALENVHRSLARTVAALADERAYRVRLESVHIRRSSVNESAMTVQFTGVWSPQTARFIGGEYDGETAHVQRDGQSGMPLDILRLPYRAAPFLGDEGSVPTVSQHPAYERSGIDPIDDVWVYTHISTRR